jgi:DNA polymerase epsilon subunit 4
MVARDATFLISLATEEFIKRLSQACQRLAEREKRTTVQQKDVGKVFLFCVLCCSSQRFVANIVRRADEFLFLEGRLTDTEGYQNRRSCGLLQK